MNLALASLLLVVAAEPPAPKVELLWPKGAPGAKGSEPADKPQVTVYRPAEKTNGTAVVVCPGGGYGGLAMNHEGKDIAAFLNKLGVTAFVLQYRHAPKYRHPAPLQDVQRAIRLVRSRAEEWGVDPKRVGVMGFSAGGHLGSTAATHFDDGKPDAEDPIDRAGSRPDFAILCYPVITLKPPYAHMGSRNNLLGPDAPEELVASLCNDQQVSARTPPTFLFHTSQDTAVPPENSVLFYQAREHKVPAEMHIYEKGQHGVGLAPRDPVLSSWPDRLAAWLQSRDLLGKEPLPAKP